MSLTRPFSKEEFQETIFSMHLDKSPGPDGLNPGFYQKNWGEIGEDLFSSATSWLMTSAFPSEPNDMNIVLAPKGDNPETIKDLRPISLCNVLYKTISKVLANRLKPLIGSFISLDQAAFVPTRSIMDNALSTFEILHFMKCKHKGKKGEVALKLDISKAFDSVNWTYLCLVKKKMGFCDCWISWIKMCITSVEYHVLFNGDRIGLINPTRRLCAEGLSALIKYH